MQDVVIFLGSTLYVLYSNGTAFVPVYANGTSSAPSINRRRLSQASTARGAGFKGTGEAGQGADEGTAVLDGLSRRRAALQAFQARYEKSRQAAEVEAEAGPASGTSSMWPLSVRQQGASKRLLEHARAQMVVAAANAGKSPNDTSSQPLLVDLAYHSPSSGDSASSGDSGRAAGSRRRLQQTAANKNQAPLAVFNRNIAGCWFPLSYGVQLVSNVPGDQLLMLCNSGGACQQPRYGPRCIHACMHARMCAPARVHACECRRTLCYSLLLMPTHARHSCDVGPLRVWLRLLVHALPCRLALRALHDQQRPVLHHHVATRQQSRSQQRRGVQPCAEPLRRG